MARTASEVSSAANFASISSRMMEPSPLRLSSVADSACSSVTKALSTSRATTDAVGRIDHAPGEIEDIALERQSLRLQGTALVEDPGPRHMIHEIDGLAGDGAGIHPARATRQNRLLRLVDVPVDEKVAALDREGRHGAGIAAVEGDVVMGEPGAKIHA